MLSAEVADCRLPKLPTKWFVVDVLNYLSRIPGDRVEGLFWLIDSAYSGRDWSKPAGCDPALAAAVREIILADPMWGVELATDWPNDLWRLAELITPKGMASRLWVGGRLVGPLRYQWAGWLADCVASGGV